LFDKRNVNNDNLFSIFFPRYALHRSNSDKNGPQGTDKNNFTYSGSSFLHCNCLFVFIYT